MLPTGALSIVGGSLLPTGALSIVGGSLLPTGRVASKLAPTGAMVASKLAPTGALSIVGGSLLPTGKSREQARSYKGALSTTNCRATCAALANTFGVTSRRLECSLR